MILTQILNPDPDNLIYELCYVVVMNMNIIGIQLRTLSIINSITTVEPTQIRNIFLYIIWHYLLWVKEGGPLNRNPLHLFHSPFSFYILFSIILLYSILRSRIQDFYSNIYCLLLPPIDLRRGNACLCILWLYCSIELIRREVNVFLCQ